MAITVLHIASFNGNIGDNANHIGSKWLREKYLDYEFSITEKEIREFYWKEWLFNTDVFVNEANSYDLIMIGGGNYFELWVEGSSTGTSIDISMEFLKKINRPVLFYGLGFDLGQGIPPGNQEKFQAFMDYLTADNQFLVVLRNDGAMNNIRYLYNDRYEGKIFSIADGGFFTHVDQDVYHQIGSADKRVVINLAGDMLEKRFNGNSGAIKYTEFVSQFAAVIEAVSMEYTNLKWYFVPHIFRDLVPIYDVLDCLEDKIRRKSTLVAPCLIGKSGHDFNMSLYKYSSLVIGMRFHSNVCGIAFNRPTIGLVNYDQIFNLYEELKSGSFVDVRFSFAEKLIEMIKEKLDESEKNEIANREIQRDVLEKSIVTLEKINRWLHSHFGEVKND